MKKQITCNHPNLFPTQWNQAKPEPYTGDTCDCGMNFSCPVCCHGFGAYPCECVKKNAVSNYSVYSGIESIAIK